MLNEGFFVSVISPQGGSGVSTLSIALGDELSSRQLNTTLLAPGANYEYYPDFNYFNVNSLTNAYFLYTKGKPVYKIKETNRKIRESNKPIEIFFNKLEQSYKTDITFYSSFNNFLEIDEISNSDYMNFIMESFKSQHVTIIDTNRIPPFKLCGVLDSCNMIVVVIDCRDELYQRKLEGFLKSMQKVISMANLLFDKCVYLLNFSKFKEESAIRSIISESTKVTENSCRIYSIQELDSIYNVRGNTMKFNGKHFKKTELHNLADYICTEGVTSNEC